MFIIIIRDNYLLNNHSVIESLFTILIKNNEFVFLLYNEDKY